MRRNTIENQKLMRIEAELLESIDLKEVQHYRDVEEFEGVTNNEFNRNFESEMHASGQFKIVEDEGIRGRRARRSGTSDTIRRLDEGNIKTFTFSKRYDRNKNIGRITSTLKSHTTRFPELVKAANETY